MYVENILECVDAETDWLQDYAELVTVNPYVEPITAH